MPTIKPGDRIIYCGDTTPELRGRTGSVDMVKELTKGNYVAEVTWDEPPPPDCPIVVSTTNLANITRIAV